MALVAPTIASQPAAQTVRDGQSATFTVAATGSAPFTYQWQRGGVAIAGANAATYTIATTQLSDNGAVFSVVVGNPAGSVTSSTATLTVTPVAPTLAGTTPVTVSVVEGQTATFTVMASGSSPLSFQWRRAGSPIAGANSTTYVTPPTTAADNGAVFDVVVTNLVGSIVSPLFTLVVTPAVIAPAITTQPQPQSVRAGGPATFTVVASGTAPLMYQWLRDGTAIAGAQASSYTITSTAPSDNGAQFSVRVTNAAGSVTSTPAALTVTAGAGIALLAGDVGGPGSNDGTGGAASFNIPVGIALDSAGNVYIGDTVNNLLRKITPAGVVTTFAGAPGAGGSADGLGGAARFNRLQGVAVDAAGNIYVADTDNQTIRKVLPDGTVTTLAGLAGAPGSADGTGAAARLNLPTGVATDSAGNVYVADFGNHTIRKITAAGVVTTVAGAAGMSSYADGTGAAARFNAPAGLSTDTAGNVYVADSGNHVIRKITPSGVVTTLAGSPGVPGSADGTGAAARFNGLRAVVSDATGTLYVADLNNATIRKVSPAGVVTTIAGTPGAFGSADGTGSSARFSSPLGIAVDASGTLYVADTNNSAIRKISAAAVVTTFAGSAMSTGTTDATGGSAKFNVPRSAAVDAAGNVYVADTGNNTIRKIAPGGAVTTLAGTAGPGGSADGAGAAARFNMPLGLAVEAGGSIVVADFNNNTIRRISSTGTVTTLAGVAGVTGSADGAGAAASFNRPNGVAIDGAGNIYVADSGNHSIRKITSAGVVTTYAGVAGTSGSADGPGAAATFNMPAGVAVDGAGNVYVGDARNAVIRKIDASRIVSTLAGSAGLTGSADGTGSAARFNNPIGLVVDAMGNVYVADSANNTIRKITPAGVVTTVVGVADGRSGVQTGALPGRLASPYLIAIDAAGNLYVTGANSVLRITLP